MKTVLSYVTGSHSYNLNRAGSDFDTLVVFMLTPDEMFGLTNTSVATQKLYEKTDVSTVEFSEYLRRLVGGNPSYVQTLFDWHVNCNFSEFGPHFYGQLQELLVADNVHKSFMGAATRMWREGSVKSKSEAVRYLKLLAQLHTNGKAKVFLTGSDRDFLMSLRSGAEVTEEFFNGMKAACNFLLDVSVLGNDRQVALNKADRLSKVWYKEYYKEELGE